MVLGACAVFLPCTLLGFVSPILGAGVAAVGAALGLAVRKAEPVDASSLWITVDASALAVRVEHVAPGRPPRLIASVPLTRDVRFVVAGSREGASLVETVELRRGSETLVEVLRHPDDVIHSFLFARVERALAGVNAEIEACAARAFESA